MFFNRYWAVRQKHLRRQLRLAFSPLKQLVLAVLHARRRLLRRAFEEWREWIRLSDELFLRVRAAWRVGGRQAELPCVLVGHATAHHPNSHHSPHSVVPCLLLPLTWPCGAPGNHGYVPPSLCRCPRPSQFVIKLRASIGSVKEHATPQQLWQLCTPPGGDPWAAKLTLGALVANVLRRQMPSRTAAMYLTAWRKAVANQVRWQRRSGMYIVYAGGRGCMYTLVVRAAARQAT